MLLEQKRYNAVDATRLIMAFFVVGIHVGTFFDVEFGGIVNFSIGMAVPFFFVCSGFFIQNKIGKSRDLFGSLKSGCIRYTKLYILWHITYFPIALKYLIVNNNGFWDNFVYCIKMFLFVGEIVFSWPLWYLHGLIVSILLIILLFKCNLSLKQIWAVSIIMMFIGYAINVISMSENDSIIKSVCQSFISFFGSADRNGPFRGFALVTTGMIIQRYYKQIRHAILIGIICVIVSFLLYSYSLPYYLLLSGGGLFLITSSINLENHPCYSSFRVHSTLIYFMHMFFVLLAHMLLKTLADIDVYVYLLWVAIFLITWIVSAILNNLRQCTHFHWINHFV